MYFLQNFTIKDALPLRELELEGFLALMGSLVEKYEYKAYSRGRGRSICLLGRRESRRKRGESGERERPGLGKGSARHLFIVSNTLATH